MARQSGYMLSIKLFVPTPKTDFEKQASVAKRVSESVKKGALDPTLLEEGDIADISGAMTSRSVETKPATPAKAA